MSLPPSGSPFTNPAAAEDGVPLPRGQCRYILLIPGIKGQRCGCAHFSLSLATPGAGCDCGHMACYHVQDSDAAADRRELDLLKQRVQALEQQLEDTRQASHATVIARLSELEEVLDRSRTEIEQEIKGSYRNITRVWQSVGQLEQRHQSLYEAIHSQSCHLAHLGRSVEDMGNRQLELFDADMSLEERLDRIEGREDCRLHVDNDTRPPTPDETPQMVPETHPSTGSHPAAPPLSSTSKLQLDGPRSLSLLPSPRRITLPISSMSQRSGGAWTVHISFLPTSSQPFPFERDTNAYKRCLSRGLHQTTVVADSSGFAFNQAVQRSFHHILKGRAWMPLKAKLCDFNQLKGLPMLRKLDPSLLSGLFDMEFLLKHCAVCDSHGNIESLYLAMRHDTLTWPFLQNTPVAFEGLEACWEYDQYLDSSDHYTELDDQDSVPRLSASEAHSGPLSMKRAAVEILEEDRDSRSKRRRTCYTDKLDLKREIETM